MTLSLVGENFALEDYELNSYDLLVVILKKYNFQRLAYTEQSQIWYLFVSGEKWHRFFFHI